jgi:hypothetical protein
LVSHHGEVQNKPSVCSFQSSGSKAIRMYDLAFH